MTAFTPGIHRSSTPVLPPSAERALTFFEGILAESSAPLLETPISRTRNPHEQALEECNKRIQGLGIQLDVAAFTLVSASELIAGSFNKTFNFGVLSRANDEIEALAFSLQCLGAASPAVAQIMTNLDAKRHLDFLKEFSKSSKNILEIPEAFRLILQKHDLSKEGERLRCFQQCALVFCHNFVTVSKQFLGVKAEEFATEKRHFLEYKERLEPIEKEVQAQAAIDQAIVSLDGFFKASTLSFADACTHYQQIAAHEGTENVSKVYLKYAEILSQHLHWFQDGTSDWGKRMFLATAAGVPGGPDASRMVYLRLVAMKWAMGQPAQL